MYKSSVSTFSLFWICLPAQAWCPSYPSISVADEFRAAAVVAKVTVAKRLIVVDLKDDPEGYEAEFFELNIDKIVKGAKRRSITAYNENASGRFPMEVGESYFAFITFDGNFFYINSCGNSTELKNSQVVAKQIQKLK